MTDESLELARTVSLELGSAETLPGPAGDATAVANLRPASGAPAERFTLGREIGRGGMGRVVEASDHQFRRTVAIKEMLPGGGPNARRRFVTEALVTGNLQHPGIPAVYERGDRPDGTSYYAMQLVAGRTLADALDEAKTLEERLALLPAVVKVAETVAYAHERGVVHRDLKPENVLLGRHGEVFLLDWGIAKVRGLTTGDGEGGGATEGTKTQVGAIMGSPMYMAPEQARGQTDAIDERTDVFALGAMLYHVLTGRAPYLGKTVSELTSQAAEGRPPGVADLAGEVSPALVEICGKAMHRTPAERHKSALELAAALEAFQSQAARRPPSRLVTGVQNAGLAALGLVTLLLLALGLTLGYGVWQASGHTAASPFVGVFLTIVGVTLAVVEARTAGHARLFGLGMTLVAISGFVTVGGLLVGFISTMGALGEPGLAQDVPRFLSSAAVGLSEMAYTPFATLPLALVQAVVWAFVARRNALAEDGKPRGR